LGVSNHAIARTLGVTEGAVRSYRRRLAVGASDGRAKQSSLASAFRDAFDAYLDARDEKTPSSVQDLHAFESN